MWGEIGRFLIDCKIWLARASSYVAILNMGMLMLLVIDKLKQYGYRISLEHWGISIFIATLVLLILVGYADWRFGLYRYETSRTQQQNPELQQIREDVAEIRRLLQR